MTAEPAFRPAAEDDAALRDWLRAEAARPFAGWDFSRLDGRMIEEPIPWDYRQIVTGALASCRALLDMGTGGGEFLSSLSPLPPLACATEGYAPNILAARARLEPLGIQVRALDEDDHGILPFDDEMFDLVINRHEYYDPAEVMRVLHPGGRFITQQVGGEDHGDLNRLLAAPIPDNGYALWTLAHARDQLAAAGFAIRLSDEALPTVRFTDAGALAHYLRVIAWQIPDFDVDRYFPRLREAHRRCQEEGSIASREHRFILIGEKPTG